MFVQEDLTVTPYAVPGVSWELPEALAGRFRQYGAFARIVLDAKRTRVVDIVEDCARRAEAEAAAKLEAAERAEQAEQAEKRARAAALEAQGVRTMARALFRSAAPEMAGDDVIRCRALAEEWAPGAYQVGDVRCLDGTPFRCAQAHDSSENPDWNPVQARALWVPYHGTGAETAMPWAAPTGAHDLYRVGECMVWADGKIMRAARDTSYSPEQAPEDWEEVTG